MSEALLASERVIPEAAMEAGFQFEHPELTEALAGIFQQARSL
jgi:NAD dependent epimerase/dehydratase family enzyme